MKLYNNFLSRGQRLPRGYERGNFSPNGDISNGRHGHGRYWVWLKCRMHNRQRMRERLLPTRRVCLRRTMS